MLDFLTIATRSNKRGVIEIYPKFMICKSNDLMIRGSDFYAIWDHDKGLWSLEEDVALRLIDNAVRDYETEYKSRYSGETKALYLWDAENGMIDRWHKYCQKQMRDNFHTLDEKILFSNSKVNKRDYASKTLTYPLEDGPINAYDRLMSVIYSEEERHKIEWAIGSIVTGDSKSIQKFLVLYGPPASGKSTVLNIIQMLFDGYYSVFDAKALGSSNNTFALEAFKSNPLIAIQHDGDLSKIEDNSRLNSLVSHELMTVNEKFKSTYSNRFKCFLFMGTNKPVKITDAKSGLIRRLIDVSPTGEKVPRSEYNQIMGQIKFELGAIACHCRDVYLENPNAYDNYIPTTMMGASNDFYNFISEYYYTFKDSNETSLKQAWEMYKTYCTEAKVLYPYPQRSFKEELKNYFDTYYERYTYEDGTRVRSLYQGFKSSKFDSIVADAPVKTSGWIKFKKQHSLLDDEFAQFPAQYANADGTPEQRWVNVDTKLKDINTSKLHYVKVPINQIFIDFDIKDKDGNKSYERNLEEANKWPATYAELSKSGCGIHLHYLYEGDVTRLSNIYDDDIEIKVLSGNSSLRRKLTKCNDIPIAVINSGLPLKGEKIKMATSESIKSERSLRTMIKRNLNKEFHPGTKPSIDFIYKILEDAYASGLKYDVSNMKNDIFNFAANSTHHAQYCTKLVMKMKLKSDDATEERLADSSSEIIFYDIEVFPNLFLVNWKYAGEESSVVRMINPTDRDIDKLCKHRLVGFNNRRYDNHIMYARMMGYSNEELYKLSQRIINGDRNAFFGEAYNLSYTDIYDYSSKKQSLKKWEIELGIHHQELGLPWDQPVPEELWHKVAEYCDNDVIATEAVWNATQGDFLAREILAAVTDMTVNDTTNSLTQRLIFGKDRQPQDQFNYRDLSKPVAPSPEIFERYGQDRTYRIFDTNGDPTYETYIPGETKLPIGYSILPFFPGYKFEKGVSTYLGDEIGEGGRVYSLPGIYNWVWDGDVTSMHPNSIIQERLFGDYTGTFADLVQTRIDIKKKDFSSAKKRLGGKLASYLTDESQAKQLSQALKIAINSVYGLTSARFDNVFRDQRNIDNIVAKRGALFMTKLKQKVEELGFIVCHIKTDSIKIPQANDDIIKFVQDFGHEYGYNFETEADFERFAIVNDAVYVAKFKDTGEWTATGTQFQVPYVFKTLFSHEPIEFKDMCETKAVSKGDLYLDMNENLPMVTGFELAKDIRAKLKAGKPCTKTELTLASNMEYLSDEDLEKKISDGHEYVFIGRVGLFCPVVHGAGGGILYRFNEGKYYAAPGTKGYRWLESEKVKLLDKVNEIDTGYYEKLVEEAKVEIEKYGRFDEFVSDSKPPKPIYIWNSKYKIEQPSLLAVDELPF